jgi:hypothetical protein
MGITGKIILFKQSTFIALLKFCNYLREDERWMLCWFVSEVKKKKIKKKNEYVLLNK